ncbi:FecR family protein [Leptospira interrogans]|uniref:Sigma factor regulatory protein, FecR/PupR family n=1 Tax=Leptospira interrogans serovar Lora str. TE 1992 TaxID=1193028 RepID=M3CIZ1_LEPIR|nr:FecR family protein [Leptospira interrogans]AKH76933.1 iron dicitrate transport regulator FecR [Leptospira interrogans serovar Bratislava]EMF41389.1 sigma factor regulatory protein, FecR/PupR family [Leptospira interrogans serovar Lora str. TE 1992]EMN08599.1 sigma factor regulatory protein, FecR/PupR family [Leptospira interrogans serovar Muenchen str. Brem 129]KLO77469.1 Sigma factor regulatory protein, FecR/PupR family [Leptospira interrogans serovar Muenchen]
MKYLTEEKYVVTVLTGLILFFSILLYFHITSGHKKGSNPEIGKIIFKNRKAQRKYDSEVLWEEIETEMKVRNRDTVRTDDGAEAVLVLNDGTEIKLDQKSMIFLDFSDKNLSIDFAYGSVSANKESGTELQIKSGETTVEVGKGDLKLSKTEDQALNLEVSKGNAKVKSGNQESNVSNNQAIELKNGKSEIRSLSISLNSPTERKFFQTSSNSFPISFSWNKAESAKEYTLEISNHPSFSKNVIRIKSNGTSLNRSLEKGTHYWRVTAINPGTGTPEFSETRSLIVLGELKSSLFTPAKSEEFKFTSNVPSIVFQWTPVDFTNNYTFELAKDKEFKEILINQEVQGTLYRWDKTKEGKYFARVTPKPSLNDLKAIPSDPVSFNVRKLEKPEPPVLKKPSDQEEISLRKFSKEGNLFVWSGSADFSEYTLEIANDSEFKNILFNKKTNSSSLISSPISNAGTYFWRVKGTLKEGDPIFTTVRQFKVQSLENLELLFPANEQELGHPANHKLTFRWQRPEPSGVYKLEVSKNSEFSGEVIRENFRSSFGTVSIPSAGEYFWKVSLLGSNGENLISSKTQKFKTSDSTPFLSQSSPATEETIDISNRESIDFRWETEGNTESVILEILEKKAGKNKSIFKKEIKGDSYSFKDFGILEEGKFTWRLSAKYKDKTGIQKFTIPVSRNFEIKLNKTIRPPEVLSPKEIYVE